MAIKLENDSKKHSGFDDSNYGTIAEEAKLKKRFTIIMVVVLVLGTLIFFDILIASNTNVGPFLAIKVKTHNDGGTKEYYGLGYKAIKYRVRNGRNTTVVGSWTLKYDPVSRVTTMEELAFSFRNNPKDALSKSYKQFFKVTGTIDSIDEKNKKVTLLYKDEDGDNYTIKAEFNLSDTSKIKKYKKGELVQINGTFIKYTPKRQNSVRTVTFENSSIA